MKKIIVILAFIYINMAAQSVPLNFQLGKISSDGFESHQPGSNTIEDIAISGDTIILATPRSVSISIDNGVTWKNCEEYEKFDDNRVSRVGLKNGVIWAGLWYNKETSAGLVPAGGGIIYSADLGDSWTFIDQPVDEQGDSLIQFGRNTLRILPVTITEQNMIYDIDFTSDAVWIASWSSGIRKSTDMGQTWQRVVLPPDELNEIHPDSVHNFDVSPVERTNYSGSLNHMGRSILVINDDIILCGTAGGINKSTDGGISWKKSNHTNQISPISGNYIWRIKYDPFDNSIWAVTWRAEDQNEFNAISRSTDMGETWTTFLPGVKTHDIAFRHFSGNSSSDIIAVGEEGIFRSSDEGINWLSSPEVFDIHKQIKINDKESHAIVTRNYDNGDGDIFIGSAGGGLIKMTESNQPWDGDWEIFFLSGEDVFAENKSFVFPNPFSPFQEKLTFKYSLHEPTDVTIRIFDFGMNLVKTLIQNAPRTASEEVFEMWDGRHERGDYVSNGVYFYRIDAGSDEPLFGKILVIK